MLTDIIYFQGVLPLDYLDNSQKFQAESIWANAQQILEQFEVKMAEKQKTTLRLLFSPYPALVESKKEAIRRSIKGLINEERFADAVSFNTQ